MRASHIHPLIITSSGWQAEHTGIQGWLGLGLSSTVFISLGKHIVAFSHRRYVQAGFAQWQEPVPFPGNAPCSQPASRLQPPPFPLGDCRSSAAGAWKQPRKGRQRGQGHPHPRLHALSESSQRGAPTRRKAGADMPVAMRSPLLNGAAMLKLASNHAGKEHQSLQALSS